MDHEWLVIAYSLPPEPSRKRVAAWRRMRKLGAVHVNEGFWFLPKTPATTSAIDDVSRDIRAEGGTAWSFAASATGYNLDELQARFNQARAADYGEVMRHCERFLNHIERETAARHFDFAVVEELEQDLEKRNRLLQQVHERDLLHFEGSAEANAGLQRCREALDRFAEEAFKHAGDA